MKILVTGGCGFIGSNFIDYIFRNTDFEVINVDALTYAGISDIDPQYKHRYTFYKASIGDAQIVSVLEKHMPNYIINFAAETHVDNSIRDPFRFVKTNILDTYNLIAMVQEYFERYNAVKFLHVSTDEVYGQLKMGDPAFTEKTPYAPNSPYSATKASSDHLVRAFQHTYGLPAIITNCSNNYGPRQYPEKLIPLVIKNALLNKAIPVYGNGLNIRDWLYVQDHCEALYLILTKGKIGSNYNIGGSAERSNIEVVQLILKLMNKPDSLIEYVTDRKGHDFRYAMDISHIKSEIGWEPKTTFENGLAQTIEWYIFNMEWIEKCVH